MTPTKRHGWRGTRALRVSGVALLLLAAGCGGDSLSANGDPTIDAKEDRNSAGVLEGLTVDGKRFAANGQARVTLLLSGGAYVEEDITVGGDGKIKYEKRPVPCPQPATTGSYVLVTVRDMTGGISSSETLSPGAEPDCKG